MNGLKTEQILEAIDIPIRRWQKPILIATFGLPAAGKTTVSALVKHQYPLVVLSTDILRLTYGFPGGPATLETMRHVAARLLADRRSVLFDGIHMMQANRDELRTFGASCHVLVRFIYVSACPETITRRLQERLKQPDETTREGKFVITPEHFARIAQHLEIPLGETDTTWVDTSLEYVSVETQLQPLFSELKTLL